MNEGHSSLLVTELLRRFDTDGTDGGDHRDYDVARIRERCIFTTHTPVEAGHDQFAYDLVERELGSTVDMRALRRFGGSEQLNMTHLALNLRGYVHGVEIGRANVRT